MKIALIGFFNSGKTTVFNVLTHQKKETSVYPASSDTVHRGVIHIDDLRLIKLSEIVKPKKTTSAQLQCVDPAGLIKNNASHNAKVIKQIVDADAFVYVLRGFEDYSVPYQFDSVNPVRDLDELEYEFIMLDLDLVTKRIEKMDEQKKKGQKVNEKEREILLFLRENLEDGKALRAFIKDKQLMEIKHLRFLTQKPVLPVINIDEKSFYNKKFQETALITICATLETELRELSYDETKALLEVAGVSEPVSEKIIREIFKVLNHIYFFTILSHEVRAWSIKKNTKAVDAAGRIHSDIQRGFIRAEVISYNDFISLEGNLSLAKQKGLLRVEGKDYEVKDGDIITFRFKI